MLLLLLLLFTPLSSPKTFTFSVNLICRDSMTHAPVGDWCYRMRIMAQRYWLDFRKDRLIAETTITCTDEFFESFELSGQLYNWFWNYDVRTVIEHNCTSTGNFLIRKRPYSKILRYEKVTNSTMNVQLFDDGSLPKPNT